MWKSAKLILSYTEYTHAVQARSPNHFFRVNVPAIPKKEKRRKKNKNKNIKTKKIHKMQRKHKKMHKRLQKQ